MASDDIRNGWLLTAFHLLYNQVAWAYDLVSYVVSLGRWRRWQEAALPYIVGPNILEIGHGPGHTLLMLADRGLRPVGLDLSAAMGHLAYRRLGRRKIPAQLTQGRGQALPFAAATFDSVLAIFPTPYILAPQTVTSIHRVLRPGGRLIVVPEARLVGHDPLTRIAEGLFAITGQRQQTLSNDQSLTDQWQRALGSDSFAVSVLQIPTSDSWVTIIVGIRLIEN